MFGVAKGADGKYFDSLSAQFNRGKNQDNPDALRQMEATEHSLREWVQFIGSYCAESYQADAVLSLLDEYPSVRILISQVTERLIHERASAIATEEFRNNPPRTLIDQQFATLKHRRDEWIHFLQSHPDLMKEFERKAACDVYNFTSQEASFKVAVEEKVRVAILEKARSVSTQFEAERRATASRAAVLLNG